MDLAKLCKDRILVFDGALGTQIQSYDLTPDDFDGLDGCNELLCVTRPDVIQQIASSYLEAGSDILETNSFGASAVVLAEYGIADRAYELNLAAAKILKEVAAQYTNRKRYVAGSIGPGTKLPSLLHITFDELKDAYVTQVEGLLDGGADLLITETSQDLLQVKAALVAIFEVFQKRKTQVPIISQVTFETTGTMLLGSDMDAVISTLSCYPLAALGMNCATGPKAMSGHVRTLSHKWDGLISVQPNAGLPKNVNGQIVYDMTPEEFSLDVSHFVKDFGVNIVGGCCGTSPAYIKALVDAVQSISPTSRQVSRTYGVSSLYSAMPYACDPKPLLIGERANANGSKKFREFLLEKNIDGLMSVAREQEAEQSHILDVCVAYTGLDEVADMSAYVEKLNTDCTIPLMIDSTSAVVIEEALKRIGGKAMVNSVNFEDGGANFHKVLKLCKKYGASIVVLTIDEDGMAKTADKKISIAKRAYDIIVDEYNLPPEDIFFDTLTFTLGSGDDEFRTAAMETLNAIKRVKSELPGARTVLGLSNISFGLKPAIRHRLNSVMLAHAVEAGLDAAILHPGKIMPLFKLGEDERALHENLLFNKWVEERNPLMELLAYYDNNEIKQEETAEMEQLPVHERLKKRIIAGNRIGLHEDLQEMLKEKPALEIVNNILLDGMKTVGELFGKGEMQLPFVLQSAETMKAAVAFLEPFMEKTAGSSSKGMMVIATVAGDVHDIGKNLVDIILTNNGYEMVNIGIKQPIEAILEAYDKNKPDVIGMSGLLVKSTVVMKENLEIMNEQGITPPVILGGAALTRNYVEKDLRALYKGEVYYARDAFDGLTLMSQIVLSNKQA